MGKLRTVFVVIILLGPSAKCESEEVNDDVEYDTYDSDEEDSKFRWSMFLPRFVENWCLRKCRSGNNPKPFSRLVGTRCQCLCPVNAGVLQLCPPPGGIRSCYDFCQQIGYWGGDCLYNESCFCYCGREQKYNASIVFE